METSEFKKQFEQLQEIAEKCNKKTLFEDAAFWPTDGKIVVRKWTNYPKAGLETPVDHYQLGVYIDGEVYVTETQKYTKQPDEFNKFGNWTTCPCQNIESAPAKYMIDESELSDGCYDEEEDDSTPVVLTAGDLRNIMSQLAELREKVSDLESELHYLQDNVEYHRNYDD